MADTGKRMLRALPDAVLRLSGANAKETFLSAHHVEAADRLLRLFERASLRQRTTISYDPSRVGRAAGPARSDLADSAASARQKLSGLARRLPPDCWGLLADICVYDKGLQQVGAERGWPRRSAKLVLRIGLAQVAQHFGLAEAAIGREDAPVRTWAPERVPMG